MTEMETKELFVYTNFGSKIDSRTRAQSGLVDERRVVVVVVVVVVPCEMKITVQAISRVRHVRGARRVPSRSDGSCRW